MLLCREMTIFNAYNIPYIMLWTTIYPMYSYCCNIKLHSSLPYVPPSSCRAVVIKWTIHSWAHGVLILHFGWTVPTVLLCFFHLNNYVCVYIYTLGYVCSNFLLVQLCLPDSFRNAEYVYLSVYMLCICLIYQKER